MIDVDALVSDLLSDVGHMAATINQLADEPFTPRGIVFHRLKTSLSRLRRRLLQLRKKSNG